MLRANVELHAPDGRVRVIDGEAPDVLADIESPDAVFVGGSGGRLIEILDVAFDRLSRPGRIVANLVTFENVATVIAWARRRDLEPEVVQISVTRGTDILGMTRLQAENPVTIVTIAV
jgi:precorrin-6Y C5,15-methyltransferase (decarboxylating)